MCLSKELLQDKFRGAILGSFLGDAFGSGFEGMNPEKARFRMSILSKKFLRSYTDDTDMTLALAESIIRSGKIDPEAGSFGNGAAMRVSPVGLFYHHDLNSLQEAAIKQATITHAHPLGQWGAVMQACSVGLAISQNPKGTFKKEQMVINLREILWGGPVEYMKALNKIEEMVGRGKKLEAREVVRSLGNGVEAQFSVPSACYIAITHSPDFYDAIQAAISLGGDTDTIAGMVGAIVGAHLGEKGLPVEWIEQLEEGPRGCSFARSLADRLFETWRKIHQTSSE